MFLPITGGGLLGTPETGRSGNARFHRRSDADSAVDAAEAGVGPLQVFGAFTFQAPPPLRFTSLGICSAEHWESGLSGRPSRYSAVGQHENA